MHASRQSGFTLIETVVAASVLMILAGIGLPSFQEAIRGFRLTSALTAYSADFAFARTGAIGRSRKVVACPSTDGRRCSLDGDWSQGWMVFVDANGDIVPDNTESVLQLHVRGDEQIPGHGVGLAVVSDLVTSHDGQLLLSHSDGGGGRVDVTLRAG